MFKFIKNIFKEIEVRCNDQELTGGKKVLAFVLCFIVIAFVLCVSAALMVGMLALALCMIPIGLVYGGIRQLVSISCEYYKYKKKKKDIANKYNEKLRIFEENYNRKCDSIKNTMESLENSTSIVKDELDTEVVAQELVPISLEDLEAYIQYISQFNSTDAQTIASLLPRLNELKQRLDVTLDREERKKLEREFVGIMFLVQDRISTHIEQINSIHDYFDKGTKKRRLFKKNL